jgi:hypothetical protein
MSQMNPDKAKKSEDAVNGDADLANEPINLTDCKKKLDSCNGALNVSRDYASTLKNKLDACEEKSKSMVPKSDTISGMNSKDFLNNLKNSVAQAPQKMVEVQLNWSEYYQGQWTTRESSGFGKPIKAAVNNDFDRSKVLIYVSKEIDEKGDERAVKIHLNGAGFESTYQELGSIIDPCIDPLDACMCLPQGANFIRVEGRTAFRLASKSSPPEIICRRISPQPPYRRGDVEATHYKCSGQLQVDKSLVNLTNPDILKKGGNFSLLTCSNASFENEELERPFFFNDNQHSFFVEPERPELPVTKIENYGIVIPLHDLRLYAADRSRDIPLVAQVSNLKKDPAVDQIDELSHLKIQPREDWITDPATVLIFGEHLVGQGGKIDLEMIPAASDVGELGKPATLGPIGFLAPGGLLEAKGEPGIVSGSIPLSGRGLNVVDGGGLRDTKLSNIANSQGSELVRSMTGIK